jgi:hypothetical protein
MKGHKTSEKCEKLKSNQREGDRLAIPRTFLVFHESKSKLHGPDFRERWMVWKGTDTIVDSRHRPGEIQNT